MAHQCWKCETVLRPTRQEYVVECPECEDDNKYYTCAACPEGLDWEDNDKGGMCDECGYHLCGGCFFRDKGRGFREVESSFLCEKCATDEDGRIEKNAREAEEDDAQD